MGRMGASLFFYSFLAAIPFQRKGIAARHS
jgi:hypothetical protein